MPRDSGFGHGRKRTSSDRPIQRREGTTTTHRENFSDGFDVSDRVQFSFKYNFSAKVIGE